MEKQFKKKLLIQLGISLALILVLLIGTYFLGRNISATTLAIQELKNELALRDQAIQSFLVLKKESAEARRYSEIIEELLPPLGKFIILRRDLKELAIQNQITVEPTFGEKTGGAPGKPGALRFTMKVSGPFENFINFLKSLESFKYFLNFASLDLNRSGNNFNATLAGQVFSRPD